jgi:hypothetical protein
MDLVYRRPPRTVKRPDLGEDPGDVVSRVGDWLGLRGRRARDHLAADFGSGREHAVVADHIEARRRDQCDQPRDEVERVEHDRVRPAAPRAFEADHKVDARELVEAQLVNAIAPALLTSRLRPPLHRSRCEDRHVVNVSAVEGQFAYANKTPRQPRRAHALGGRARPELLRTSFVPRPTRVRPSLVDFGGAPGLQSSNACTIQE